MRKIVYYASDTRHGLFADLRKLLELSWLAEEVGNVKIELQSEKYDPRYCDVNGFLNELKVLNSAYDPGRQDERIVKKFYNGFDPLRDLLGIDLVPEPDGGDPDFEIVCRKVNERPDILHGLGLPMDHPLWRELQNTPVSYSPTSDNELVRDRCNEQLLKLVTLRPQILEKIETFHRNHLAPAEHVLGVHVRFSQHYLNTHFDSEDAFYDCILSDIGHRISWVKRNFSIEPAVFLSTHLQSLVDAAESILGQQLKCRDIARNTSNDDFHYIEETLETQLEDAVVDCWLLSKCDALLGGVSNFNNTAMIINPKLPFFFLNSLAGSRGG